MSLEITDSSAALVGRLNQAIGDLEHGYAEDVRSSKISVKGNQKALEEKRQERLDKIQENLKGISHGKCLGFLGFIIKAFAAIAAPLSGGASLALGLGGILLKGLDRLQQAKAQKNYLLSKADEALLKQVIEEVEGIFDDEIEEMSQTEEQKRRELIQMRQAIETAVDQYAQTNEAPTS